MRIEDVFNMKMHSFMKEKQDNIKSDSQYLTLLSQWIKFEQHNENWQENVLTKLGSFPHLFTYDKNQLIEEFNLSEKDIAFISLIYAASIRILKSEIYNKNILQFKKYLTDYLIAFLSRETIEHFYIILLDRNAHIISISHQASGTVSTTSIHIREIAKCALKFDVESLILVHNHPSGIALPSEADKKLTYILVEALEAVNIDIADHIIIGNGIYFSFVESGLLNPQNKEMIMPL